MKYPTPLRTCVTKSPDRHAVPIISRQKPKPAMSGTLSNPANVNASSVFLGKGSEMCPTPEIEALIFPYASITLNHGGYASRFRRSNLDPDLKEPSKEPLTGAKAPCSSMPLKKPAISSPCCKNKALGVKLSQNLHRFHHCNKVYDKRITSEGVPARATCTSPAAIC